MTSEAPPTPPPAGESPDDGDRNPLDQVPKLSLPSDFAERIEQRIHKRSGGRFFGQRTWAERVPLAVIAVVVMALGLVVYWLVWSSDTRSLTPPPPASESVSDEAKQVVPRP